MKALVEYLARALTRHPEDVVVEEEQQGDRIILHLYVNEADKGRVIGREGRIANAMRAMLRAAATRAGVRVALDIE